MEKLSKIVRSYPLKEGENKTEIPFVSIYYREQRAKRTCSHVHLATAAGFFDFSTERKIDMPRVNIFIFIWCWTVPFVCTRPPELWTIWQDSILCGSCGRQFLQSVINIQQAGEIYEVNSWIKENFVNRLPWKNWRKSGI